MSIRYHLWFKGCTSIIHSKFHQLSCTTIKDFVISSCRVEFRIFNFFRKLKIIGIYFLVEIVWNPSKKVVNKKMGSFRRKLFKKLKRDWPRVLKIWHFQQHFLIFFRFREIVRIWDLDLSSGDHKQATQKKLENS